MPARRDTFVGRQSALTLIEAALHRGERLLTLVGAGGVGKTRLALELAHRFSADPIERGDGVLFCDCSEARSLDELADALVSALSLASTRAPDSVGEAGRGLASLGRVLLVLDNLEQVIEPAAIAVRRWLELAPEARLIVTSRARLRIEEELVLEVAPLGLAPESLRDAETLRACESVALFLSRSSRTKSANRKRAESVEELRTIAELTRRLDGLPLAIELCAGRTATFSPAQLLAAFDGAWPDLRAERGRPARQSTVRNAIAWSWELLSPNERTTLARLSLCRGGFDLPAVDALANDVAPAVESIASLHEQSLVRLDETPEDSLAVAPRYAMLEAVRVFAEEQLTTMGPVARSLAERRHAEHYASVGDALARSARAVGDRVASRWARREQANLLAAAERTFDDQPPLAARCLAGLSPVLVSALPYELASRIADRSVNAASRARDPSLQAQALWARGEVRRRHRLAAAEQDFRSALELTRELSSSDSGWLVSTLRAALGVALRDQGQFVAAAEQLEAALAAAEPTSREATVILLALATVRRREGRIDEAVRFGEQALSLARRSGESNTDPAIQGRALLVLGLLDDDCARLDSALARIERAVDLLRECGDRWSEEIALNATGLLCAELGRPVEARAYFDEALSICEDFGFRSGAACVLQNLAWLEASTGDERRAVERWHQAIAIAREVGHRYFEASAMAALAANDARRDRVAQAREGFAKAIACAQGFPSPSLLASIDVLEGALDLAEARALRAIGDEASAVDRERSARRRSELARALPLALRDGEVRTALRMLDAELAPTSKDNVGPSVLRVWEDGAAFQLDDGELVDLRRFGVHRRVLSELLRARAEAPELRRSVAELFAGVWPGERVGVRSMRNRVHVALCALRKAGLASALESHAEGYRIAPSVRVERV